MSVVHGLDALPAPVSLIVEVLELTCVVEGLPDAGVVVSDVTTPLTMTTTWLFVVVTSVTEVVSSTFVWV